MDSWDDSRLNYVWCSYFLLCLTYFFTNIGAFPHLSSQLNEHVAIFTNENGWKKNKNKIKNKNQGVINHHKDKHDEEREVKYYENLILLHQGPKHTQMNTALSSWLDSFQSERGCAVDTGGISKGEHGGLMLLILHSLNSPTYGVFLFSLSHMTGWL